MTRASNVLNIEEKLEVYGSKFVYLFRSLHFLDILVAFFI